MKKSTVFWISIFIVNVLVNYMLEIKRIPINIGVYTLCCVIGFIGINKILRSAYCIFK